MAYCYNNGYRYYCNNSTWYSWGRWVLFGVIVVAFILAFFLCSCISQRRRRKAGKQPMYGTGWTSNLPVVGGGNQYGANYQNKPNYQAPPPTYPQQENPQHSGYYNGQNQGGQNQSYFGGQQTDVEMQPPQNVYGARNEGGYAPPSGPPPGKFH